MGNSRGDIRIINLLSSFQPASVINILFGALRNPGHCSHRLRRIKTGSALAGEHNCRGAVINRIGDIRCFRPCWSGISDHGFQHLGRRNHMLSELFRPLDHSLLYNRHFLHGYLHSHIASCHHNSVRSLKNLVQVADSLHILDLRNHLHMAAACFQYPADLQNILPAPDKGRRKEIVSHITAEHNITSVRLTDIRHGQNGSRNIDPLIV